MKTNSPWMLGGLICLLMAGLAYGSATGMLAGLSGYRSPLHERPPVPGPALAEPASPALTRRVVFILADALRADTALDAVVMPHLDALRRQGAWAVMRSRPPSFSQPGYATLLTGAWPELNGGPVMNIPMEEIQPISQDHVFLAAQRAGLKTALAGYYWFEKLLPPESLSVSFYTPGEDRAADEQVLQAALPWLEDPSYQLVLIHLDQVDYAGHNEGGPQNPNWKAAAGRVDQALAEITRHLDFSQDTLLLCSDHGQIDPGGHGGQDLVALTEPLLWVGAGVQPGQYEDVQMVDVAPTLAALLGLNLPASSQGKVRTDLLRLPPERLAVVQAAQEAQQSQLLEAYTAAIGGPLAPGTLDGAPGLYQAALEAARQQRLEAERLPRILLLGAGVLLCVGLLLWRVGARLTWLLAGAAVYGLVFNLSYTLLEKNTYSFSSVRSPEHLLMTGALRVGVALGFAWLVVLLAEGDFRKRPVEAANRTFGLVLLILFLLLLPVGWSFALNGWSVTWALPDFLSHFLALLSWIQILLVAVWGLGFAGLAALVTRRPAR